MGQYWLVVNLDKKEYVNPHKLGCGLKLREQLANHPSTGSALLILCAAMPERRGGGDFDLDSNWHGPERKYPEHNCTPAPMPEGYQDIAHRTIGRWAGDRIALIGDYAEKQDLRSHQAVDTSEIYSRCRSSEEINRAIEDCKKRLWICAPGDKAIVSIWKWLKGYRRALRLGLFTDVSDDVCAVIEHELNGKFVGDGWREFKQRKETLVIGDNGDRYVVTEEVDGTFSCTCPSGMFRPRRIQCKHIKRLLAERKS